MAYMHLSILDYVKNIRRARIKKGWSQKELAERSGMPQSHISKIERGETDLRFSSLIELVRLLDLEVVIIPKKTIPAVRAVIRQITLDKPDIRPAYSLDDEEDEV